ncbi:MAG: cytochrome c3 family protein [Sulfuritalea sp.]|nr:cytochrome c3 family protein [Sulfuritalea sp.]
MKANTWISAVACVFLLALPSVAGAADLKQAGKDVRSGKIAIGKTYSMEKETRYHAAHVKVAGLNCQACHLEEFPSDMLMVGREKTLSSKNPGPVDRVVCVACHRGGGPGKLLYGLAVSD